MHFTHRIQTAPVLLVPFFYASFDLSSRIVLYRIVMKGLLRFVAIVVFLGGMCLPYVYAIDYNEELIDEVVAEIDGEAVTLFDVERFWRIEQMLNGKNWRVLPPYDVLGRTLIQYLNRNVLLMEMDRLGFDSGPVSSPEDIRKQIASRFMDKAERELFFLLADTTESAVVRMVMRQQMLFRLLKRRATLYVNIKEDEIEAEIHKMTKGASLSKEEHERLSIVVRNRLYKRKFASMLQNWLQELYRRHQVKILAKWAPVPFSEPKESL